MRQMPMRRLCAIMRPMLALLALATAALACNLGAAPPPTPTPFQFVTPPQVVITATPLFRTNTPFVIPTVACVPRTDWPIYFVQSGDSLSSIAARSGTTTAVLVQANCLVNADQIFVGQALRVPRQPVIITPTRFVTQATSLAIQSIILDPSSQVGSGQFQVPPGLVTLRAVNVVGAVRVVYLVQQVGQPSPVTIAEALTPGTNWLVQWTVPSNITAQVWAVAVNQFNQTVESPRLIVFSQSSAGPSIGTLSVSPSQPDPLNPSGLTLAGTTSVLLSASGVQNAQRVLFYFVDVRPGNLPIQIGEDTNLSDGAAIIWNTQPFVTIPNGLIWAQAVNALGQAAQTASIPVTFIAR